LWIFSAASAHLLKIFNVSRKRDVLKKCCSILLEGRYASVSNSIKS
jgi:hypothetical protein